jgi:DNA mismatch endonuclease, patch repair protein
MSRIKGMNTSPERAVRRCAYTRGLRYRVHVMSLPGRPDMVFAAAGLVVFIDGDFWHGWHFPRWCGRLSPYWREKIERNRRRDRRNFQNLRRAGWRVLRLWEHEVVADVETCVDRIVRALKTRRDSTARGENKGRAVGPNSIVNAAIAGHRRTRSAATKRRGDYYNAGISAVTD